MSNMAHKHDTNCLHCAVTFLCDEFAERLHMETGEPMNIDHAIEAILDVVAGYVAMYDDAKLRKFIVKRAQDTLARQVRERRATGVYPGGPSATLIRPMTEQ